MQIHEVIEHLLKYVVENNALELRDVYAFTQLHTNLGDEEVSEVVNQLRFVGIEITGPDLEEDAAIEDIEEREKGLVRESTQIYMRDIADYALLTRDEEIECAMSMHAAMSEVLAALAPIKSVANHALAVFKKVNTLDKIDRVIAGLLDPVDITSSTSVDKDDSDSQSDSVLAEAYDRVQTYQTTASEFFSSQLNQRSANKILELEQAFRSFKFTTNHYHDLLRLGQNVGIALEEQLESIYEICSTVGLARRTVDEKLLPNLTGHPVSDVIRYLPQTVHEALKLKIRNLEAARHEIRRLEIETELDYKEIRQRHERIQKGANEFKSAMNRLIVGNLRLVMATAQKYQQYGFHQLDLVQEGNLGLMRAAEKFDYTKGFKFVTYATWWIRQYISVAAVELARTVKLPVPLNRTIQKVNRSRTTLTQILAREPTLGEIASHANLRIEEVKDATIYEMNPISADEPVNEEDGSSIIDNLISENVPTPEDLAMQQGLREAVELALADLTIREAQILVLRYGIGHSDEMPSTAVAEELSLPPNRVRQVSLKALRRLRNPKFRNLLEPYL